MNSVYLSSTALDLKDHRRAVIDILGKCGYAVDAMEQYEAREDRPRDVCERGASGRDVYVGLFAWRYGYVPEPDNPQDQSITELEYLAAGRANKPRLVFLLAEDQPWPEVMKDAPGDKPGVAIRVLRANLITEHWAAFFRSPEDLAAKVMTSIFQLEATHRAERLGALELLQIAPDFGPSYLGNINEFVQSLSAAKFVTFRLGPTPWWHNRLHLVAALAADFTEMEQFVILDEKSRFVVMASPTEIRRALAKSDSRLERAYLDARERPNQFSKSDVETIISGYGSAIESCFGKPEKKMVEVLTLRRMSELGIRNQGIAKELGDRRHSDVYGELLRETQPYVLLMRDGQLQGIVDRLDFAARIAMLTLQ